MQASQSRAQDVGPPLRSRMAVLTGGRDKCGRAVLTLSSSCTQANPDHFCSVLTYLMSIPSDRTKDLGFTVVMDMRHKTPWNAIKPVLKVLNDQFGNYVHIVLIMKPEKFWDKQKANFSSVKYSFEVCLVTVSELHRYIDPSQLTVEFEGTCVYDHDEWIELRIAIESLLWPLMDCLTFLERIREDVDAASMPESASKTKQALEDIGRYRQDLQSKVTIGELEERLQQLSHRLSGGPNDNGDSDYGSGGFMPQSNPDLATALPHLNALMERIHTVRSQLDPQISNRKRNLEMCFQLQLFQQDAEKMQAWLRKQVELFLATYADIGSNYERSCEAQAEHQSFARSALSTSVNVEHVGRVASRLLDSGHYAREEIERTATRLERDWHAFTQALDQRSQLLQLSTLFQLKSEHYQRQLPTWQQQSSELVAAHRTGAVAATDLELAISHHQEIMDAAAAAYTEASEAGKSLFEALKTIPVAVDSAQISSAVASDYSTGTTHVLELLHRLLDDHRSFENAFCERRLRLHQRLALVLFEQDVQQVMDWLDQHGEFFLRKNPGVGTTLQRARALQRSHQHFQQVITQNTYCNAKKLLEAATELSSMPEAASRRHEVLASAERLRERVRLFDRHVEARKRLLDLAVLFHTHYKELLSWFDEVERGDGETRVVGQDLAACEQRMEDWLERNNKTLEATDTTQNEGRQLMGLLKQAMASNRSTTPSNSSTSSRATSPLGSDAQGDIEASMRCVQAMLEDIERRQQALNGAWQSQHAQLSLSIQARLFSQDCNMVIGQLEGWCEDMRWICAHLQSQRVEEYLPIQLENNARVQSSIAEIMENAEELKQTLVTSEGEYSLITTESVPVTDEVAALCDRVRSQQVVATELAQHTLKKLQQAVDLNQLKGMAEQSLAWIQQEEQLLLATLSVPSNYVEAEQLIEDHEHFQNTIKNTQVSIVRVQERATQLLQAETYAAHEVHGVAQNVLTRWRQLCAAAEDRYKLLRSAMTYYRTIEQVVPVLDRLESDYEKGEDVCQVLFDRSLESGEEEENTRAKIEFVQDHLNRHFKNKESFLKGCSLARKNCELFVKYIRRQLNAIVTHTGAAPGTGHVLESKVEQFLDELRPRESRILSLWTAQKKAIDRCQQFVLFEASAKQVLQWIHDDAEPFIANAKVAEVANRGENERALTEYEAFRISVKEQRERIRLLVQIDEGVQSSGTDNLHAPHSAKCMTLVLKRYADLAARLDKHRMKLLAALGRPETADEDILLSKPPKPATAPKPESASAPVRPSATAIPRLSDTTHGKRISGTGKINLVMRELVQSERSYIKDLKETLDHYLEGMKKAGNVPEAIRGREREVFSNIEDIHKFHDKTFVAELEKYESIPEDVGHCFVTWAQKLQALYVPFCRDKELYNHLVISHSAFFQKIQHREKLSLPLPAYLIKPVQRIVKYEQLLEELIKCSPGQTELREQQQQQQQQETLQDARDIMHNVPLRANDILHLGSLEGCGDVSRLGDLLLTEAFTIWYPRSQSSSLFKKAQVRRVFLFDQCLVMSKATQESAVSSHDSPARCKYLYKHKIMISEINITEHIEGDQAKFAIWPGLPPPPDDVKTIFKPQSGSREVKEQWVRRIKELKLAQVLHFDDKRLLQAEISLLSQPKLQGPEQTPAGLKSPKKAGLANGEQAKADDAKSAMERSISQPSFQVLSQASALRSSKLAAQQSTQRPPLSTAEVRKTPSLDFAAVAAKRAAADDAASDDGTDATSDDLPPPMGAINAPDVLAAKPTSMQSPLESNPLRTEQLSTRLQSALYLEEDAGRSDVSTRGSGSLAVNGSATSIPSSTTTKTTSTSRH